MKISFYSLLLVILGFIGILVSLTFDLFRASPNFFGMRQFAGFVMSSIVALTGLNRLFPIRSRAIDFLLFGGYFTGILFMGLRPRYYKTAGLNHILESTSYSSFDFIINVIGFIPLSYLMMLSLFALKRTLKMASASMMVFASCMCISLLIEILQYYIPGRSSQLFDVIANGMGVLIGITYYLFEFRTPPG